MTIRYASLFLALAFPTFLWANVAQLDGVVSLDGSELSTGDTTYSLEVPQNLVELLKGRQASLEGQLAGEEFLVLSASARVTRRGWLSPDVKGEISRQRKHRIYVRPGQRLQLLDLRAYHKRNRAFVSLSERQGSEVLFAKCRTKKREGWIPLYKLSLGKLVLEPAVVSAEPQGGIAGALPGASTGESGAASAEARRQKAIEFVLSRAAPEGVSTYENPDYDFDYLPNGEDGHILYMGGTLNGPRLIELSKAFGYLDEAKIAAHEIADPVFAVMTTYDEISVHVGYLDSSNGDQPVYLGELGLVDFAYEVTQKQLEAILGDTIENVFGEEDYEDMDHFAVVDHFLAGGVETYLGPLVEGSE